MLTILQSSPTRKIQRAPNPARSRRPRPREHHHAGRADEHRRAFAILRAIAFPHGFRVVADAEGWPRIPGRLGHVEPHEGARLAAFTTRRLVRGRLLAVPGVVRHQVGDRELRVLFPLEVFPMVAAILRARRRRVGRPLTAEQALKLRAIGRVGATLATQEPT